MTTCTPQYIVDGCRAVAQREFNACKEFENVVMGFLPRATSVEAIGILNLYRKLKVVKYDSGIGRFNVKHGMYYDYDILVNAVVMAYEDGTIAMVPRQYDYWKAKQSTFTAQEMR